MAKTYISNCSTHTVLTLPSLYHLSLLFEAEAAGDDDDDGDDSGGGGEATSPFPSLPLVRRRQVRLSELAFSTCSELSPKICVSGTANEVGSEGHRLRTIHEGRPHREGRGGEGDGPKADIAREVARASRTVDQSKMRTRGVLKRYFMDGPQLIS